MSPSDPVRSTHDRRQRRLLIVLALGFVVFAAAAAALSYVLQPETLRIAVGPAGSDDHQVVQAMAEAFGEESRTVKLSPITTEGAAESLAGPPGAEAGRQVGLRRARRRARTARAMVARSPDARMEAHLRRLSSQSRHC